MMSGEKKKAMIHLQLIEQLKRTLLRALRDGVFKPQEWLLDEPTRTLINRNDLLVKIRLGDEAVLCYGPNVVGTVPTPDCASVKRLPQPPEEAKLLEETLKTWHFESSVVALVLLIVLVGTGGPRIEWVGSAAVFFGFCYASVSFRMSEQVAYHEQQTGVTVVSCYKWSTIIF